MWETLREDFQGEHDLKNHVEWVGISSERRRVWRKGHSLVLRLPVGEKVCERD